MCQGKIDVEEDDVMEQFRKFVMKNEDDEDYIAVIKKLIYLRKKLSNKIEGQLP